MRELENAVERAVILMESGKKIEVELLGLVHLSSSAPKAANPRKTLKRKNRVSPKLWRRLRKVIFSRFWQLVMEIVLIRSRN